MEHRISHDNLDEDLKRLEDDYVEAVRNNNSKTVEGFVEKFMYDSWDYNEQNIDLIQSVLRRYAKGEIHKTSFQGAFNEMVDYVHEKLVELDAEGQFPVIHQPNGASILVSLVDGLVIQYYTNVYSVEYLKEMTPQLVQMILNALKTKMD